MTKKTKKSLPRKRMAIGLSITLVGIIYAIVAVILVITVLPSINNSMRKYRIVEIYNSLELSDDYVLDSEDVFGDKRVYDYDSSRTESSVRYYTREADEETTAAELGKAAETAGFVFIDEPYPGALGWQYHYKSGKNEYLRMSIETDDDVSSVTIKVNLDDNNE